MFYGYHITINRKTSDIDAAYKIFFIILELISKTKELTTFFIIWLNFILDWYCFDVWLSWL